MSGLRPEGSMRGAVWQGIASKTEGFREATAGVAVTIGSIADDSTRLRTSL